MPYDSGSWLKVAEGFAKSTPAALSIGRGIVQCEPRFFSDQLSARLSEYLIYRRTDGFADGIQIKVIFVITKGFLDMLCHNL